MNQNTNCGVVQLLDFYLLSAFRDDSAAYRGDLAAYRVELAATVCAPIIRVNNTHLPVGYLLNISKEKYSYLYRGRNFGL